MIRRRTQQGMTLVEILFAFAIVSTVLTIAYASALNAWRNAVSANQRTQAQFIAQQGIESIRAFRESQGFAWSGVDGFIDDLPNTGGDFHLALVADGGPPNARSYVCPTWSSECKFEIQTGSAPLNAVGAAGDTSDGSALSINDSTIYTLTIRPINFFVEDNDVAQTGAIPIDGEVTAITFEAVVSWTSATNVNSNAVASTIITRL